MLGAPPTENKFMSQPMSFTFRVFEGPNLHAPYPAVLAEFSAPEGGPLPGIQLQRHLTAILTADLAFLGPLPEHDQTFAQLAALLTLRACDVQGAWGFRHEVQQIDGQPCRITVEQISPQATIAALKVGLNLAVHLRQRCLGVVEDAGPCLARVRAALGQYRFLHSDPTTLAQLRAARRRGIPVHALASEPRFWLFGQGSAGHMVACSSDDRDSYTGSQLSREKHLTAQIVRRLGFPAPEHGVAKDASGALALARRLGFPVVVKPLNGDMGHGVTADITSEQEVLAAFQHAVTSHPGPVLVERHVPGDVHRLVALNGCFAWANRRRSAQVIGDGTQTVESLLAAENQQRGLLSPEAFGFLRADAQMLALLAKQDLTLQSRPEAGRRVRLGTTSNRGGGGTNERIPTGVHPDNQDLVASLSRAFRLNTLGIDFITQDITRSWREGNCAVIEVNASPGMGRDDRAEALLDARFPDGSKGRIPTLLLIDAPATTTDALASALADEGTRAGVADDTRTLLGGHPRFTEATSLAARVHGLLLDPGCEALVVSTTTSDLMAHGLPLDRFDLMVTWSPAEPTSGVQKMMEHAAGQMVWMEGPIQAGPILDALRNARCAES